MTLIKTYYPYIITSEGGREGTLFLCNLYAGDICVIKKTDESESGWGIYKWGRGSDFPDAVLFEDDIENEYLVEYQKAKPKHFDPPEIGLSFYENARCIHEELKKVWEKEMNESMVECVRHMNVKDNIDRTYSQGEIKGDGELLDEMTEINQEAGLYDEELKVLDIQHGGSHYKDKTIQPIEYILANDMDFCSGNVVKYITRHVDKGGKEDLMKAKHYVEFLIDKWERESDK